MRNRSLWALHTALLLSLISAVSTPSRADTFQVTPLAPGIQSPVGTTDHYETFNAGGTANGFTTTFNGSSYVGTYTGDIIFRPADIYGGANGIGFYPQAYGAGATYTLSLNKGANYFGLWLSAFDPGNEIQFYRGGSLLYTLTPQTFVDLVGSCSTSPYCGNPNNGEVLNQQFAYLNFYDLDGTFDAVRFTETLALSGFETDNHAVDMLSPVPEPLPLVYLATGILALGFVRRYVSPFLT